MITLKDQEIELKEGMIFLERWNSSEATTITYITKVINQKHIFVKEYMFSYDFIGNKELGLYSIYKDKKELEEKLKDYYPQEMFDIIGTKLNTKKDSYEIVFDRKEYEGGAYSIHKSKKGKITYTYYSLPVFVSKRGQAYFNSINFTSIKNTNNFYFYDLNENLLTELEFDLEKEELIANKINSSYKDNLSLYGFKEINENKMSIPFSKCFIGNNRPNYKHNLYVAIYDLITINDNKTSIWDTLYSELKELNKGN